MVSAYLAHFLLDKLVKESPETLYQIDFHKAVLDSSRIAKSPQIFLWASNTPILNSWSV